MKKRLMAVLAVVMSVSMMFTACSKDNDNSEVTGNVITQGVAVTDDNGAAVTDKNGETVTEPATSDSADGNTTASAETGTLNSEQVWEQIEQTTAPVNVAIETVDYKSRYGYNTLTADEKALYEAILEAAKTCKFKLAVSDNVTKEIWAKIFGMVYNQEPQLFYMNPKLKVGKIYYTENDPEKIAQMQKDIDATADRLVAEASTKGTTFEKLKVFHDYLALNSTFEETDSLVEYNASIYNAFGNKDGKQGSIQCAGYAKAMQYLCDKSGIECMVVTGTNKDGASHAWNVVKVDGAWYNLDTTWDDPILKNPDYTNVRYAYFLVPDEWIHNKSHYNINQHALSSSTITYFTPPACTETKENYFVKNNLVYSDFTSADKAIKDAMLKTADSKMRPAEIMVSTADLYEQILAKKDDYGKWIEDNSKKNSIKGITNDRMDGVKVIEFNLYYN